MKINITNLDDRQIHDLLGCVVVPPTSRYVHFHCGLRRHLQRCTIQPCYSGLMEPAYPLCFLRAEARTEEGHIENIGFSNNFMVNIMDETFIEPVVKAAAEDPGDVEKIKEVGLTRLHLTRNLL
ncbi:hypothetical protein ACFL0M_12735 [Thermodesulfobacteriota bacterium]